MADNKAWTGERLETFVQNENTNEHLHRYALALSLVEGKNVLDIACGEGYGSNLLAGVAKTVVGVDIDENTIDNASKKYKKENLRFLSGAANAIPWGREQFDVVVSFETIEHHDRHDEMMQEVKRVLMPGGLLIISSPDKLFYSDKPGYKNPFHVKELYADEFKLLLRNYFKHSFFLRQKSFTGSVIVPEIDATNNYDLPLYHGGYDGITRSEFEAVYLIGIASDADIPSFKTTFFDGHAVLKQQFTDFQHLVTETVKADVKREIGRSRTYRLGSALITPFKWMKKLFNGST